MLFRSTRSLPPLLLPPAPPPRFFSRARIVLVKLRSQLDEVISGTLRQVFVSELGEARGEGKATSRLPGGGSANLSSALMSAALAKMELTPHQQSVLDAVQEQVWKVWSGRGRRGHTHLPPALIHTPTLHPSLIR